jgi:CheY-like chemotaxis protein
MIDIYMPVMNGMTMLAELKKDEALMGIPVVMVTNVQEELENAVKAGAEEAILKSSLMPHQIIDVCKKYVPLSGQPGQTT